MDAALSVPEVSVIIPARNEEVCLGACLESLAAQSGVNFEIIVVDDFSTDSTPEIAKSFKNVRVIQPPPLPSGWTGKNNALVAGAALALGDWLLFTDSDTVHEPGSLARSLAEAKQRTVEMLSYSPAQVVDSFREKAVMPVIFAELSATFQPTDVNDPASQVAAANGQYILISRKTYDSVGGHSSVATELLEDVALARAVKLSRHSIFFRYGGDAVRTRMYRNFNQLREGWTKNLALLFPDAIWLAAKRSVEFVLIGMAMILTISSAVTGHFGLGLTAGAVFVVAYTSFFIRIRRAHFKWDANLAAFFGLPMFSYLLMRSRLFHQKGKVSWKGRTYGMQAKSGNPSGSVEKVVLNASNV
jgi:glycosyltransferase involved in cell wall biosynthesis